jgi:hypothetical protein
VWGVVVRVASSDVKAGAAYMQTPRLFHDKRAITYHEVIETDLRDVEIIGNW